MSFTSKNPRQKVTVRVPATTANLGPGFDTLGMGIDIWNEISVERAAEFSISTEGEGAGVIPEDIDEHGRSKHMVIHALRRAFEYAGEALPPVRVVCRNRVPVCSGFGSSSAAIVGGLVAGLALAGTEVRANYEGATRVPEQLLQLATEMEGHPDNVAPAIYGGIQLSVAFGPGDGQSPQQLAMSRRIPIPEGMRLVAYVPSQETRFSFASSDKTVEMRALLPARITREDAVVNIQRTALLVDALHRGDFDLLTHATVDRMHQPQRSAVYPHLAPMIAAAKEAGAHGAFLSGAGPTVLAICSGATGGDVFTQCADERNESKVAAAMRAAVENLPSPACDLWKNGHFYICSPCERGAHVVAADPPLSDHIATFGTLDGLL